MKKLFLVLFLFIGIGTYANPDSTYITNSNVEKLVDKYSAKVEAVIVSLSKKLEQPVEHIYKLLIKQQIVESITWLSTALLLIFPIIFTKFWINQIRKDEYSADGWVIGFVFLCILPAIAGLLTLIIRCDIIITGFVNPEYGAIKEILELIK